MKVLVAISAVACIAAAQVTFTEEQLTKIQAEKKTCSESSGVDDAFIIKIRSGEHLNDAKAYSFVDCMFKLMGLINDDGVIQVDVIKSKIPADFKKEEVDKFVAVCDDKTLPKEKKAYEGYLCFKKYTQGKLELIP